VPDRLQEIEARLEELARALRGLQARVEQLEVLREPGSFLAASPAVPAPPARERPGETGTSLLAFVGRTLVALGGGYLIRAFTDSGGLPPLGGVAAGLLYASLWLVAAERAAAAGQRASASFHGATAGLIAFPLLWETTIRLGILRPPPAALLLVLAFAAVMGLATRRDLPTVAWLGTGLALGTAASVLLATHHLTATVTCLLALAAVVESVALRDLWTGLRWPAALAVDAGVLAMVSVLTREGGPPEDYPPLPLPVATVLAIALPTLYWAALASRTLLRRREVSAFEIVQGAASLLVGLGGAWNLLRAEGASVAPLGTPVLLMGALGYAIAFAFVERRFGHDRNFYFYSTVGGVLTLLGSRLLLGPGLAAAWSLLALAAASLGRRFDRMTLRFHGALYVGAAVAEAGLVGVTSRSFLGPWPMDQPPLGTEAWLTAVAAVATCAVLALDPRGAGRPRERIPQVVAAATTAAILAGLVTRALAGLASSAAALATLRTGVLALFVLALAWAGRRLSLAELGLLVYPTLALSGLKLLAQDLPEGHPLTLFLSLALYGGALILGPRLLRARTNASPP
jgi:hypothetical protein